MITSFRVFSQLFPWYSYCWLQIDINSANKYSIKANRKLGHSNIKF